MSFFFSKLQHSSFFSKAPNLIIPITLTPPPPPPFFDTFCQNIASSSKHQILSILFFNCGPNTLGFELRCKLAYMV